MNSLSVIRVPGMSDVWYITTFGSVNLLVIDWQIKLIRDNFHSGVSVTSFKWKNTSLNCFINVLV